MMKRKVFLVLLLSLLLTGCGQEKSKGDDLTKPSEESRVEQTKESTTVSESSNAEDATNETSSENASVAEEAELINGMQIWRECPVKITLKRADVKYGTVVHETYYSETTGGDRGVNILLPAEYDESKEYPTLYLLHGIFGNEYSFTSDSSNKISEVWS